MAFYSLGKYIRPSDGQTVTWEESVITNDGCVFSRNPFSIDKLKLVCTLFLQATNYGRALIGVLFRNPLDLFGCEDGNSPSLESNHIKWIRHVNVKNRKVASVEFTYNGSLESYIRYDGSAPHQLSHVDIPSGTKSFWVVIQLVFGDINVSLAGGSPGSCQFKKMGRLSENIVLYSEGSVQHVQLHDMFKGHRCRLRKKLCLWDILILKVSKNVPRGEGRSLFKILFRVEHRDNSGLEERSMHPFVYAKENFNSDVCFVHQGHSILCGDKVICPVSGHGSVDIEIEIVLSSVQLIAHCSVLEWHSSVQPPTAHSSAPLEVRRSTGDSLDSSVQPPIPHRSASLEVQRSSGDSSGSSYSYIDPHESTGYTACILQYSYYKLVEDIKYLKVLDILYSKGKMTKEQHRILVYGQENDDWKKRKAVEWMIDNARSITESELTDIFREVGQQHLLVHTQIN